MSTEENKQKVEEEKKASEAPKEEEVDDKEAKQDPTAENEIRVAAKGQIKNYLGYAFRILNKTNHKSLKIRATGNAIVKANILIELVKRRVGDLHQLNSIYSMVIKSTESKNPIGETTEMRRRVTAMDTLLSKEPLDETDPGYQKPEPKEEPYHGSRGQPRKKEQKEEGGEKKERRKRGPKVYNPDLADEITTKDKKDGQKKKDDKKKDQKKDGKDEKKGRRSRREKLATGNVKDDEQDKKDRGKKDRRRERGGRQMMHPDMYGPRMGMMPGPDGRGYPMYHPQDPRRPRDPRAMPVYSGYPVRSYDDFNVRPNRGGKNGRRGPPMNDPRQGMYYPPYYDPYMMYPEYGPRRYGPREQRQFNPPDENEQRERGGPRQFNPTQRGGGPPMYNEPRGGRPDGFRGRGMPPEKMGNPDDQKEFRPPRGEYRPTRGEPQGPRGGRGNFNRELKSFNPRDDQKGPDGGLDRTKFGDAIRGNRGMRGSRGSGRGGRGGDAETGRGGARKPGEPFKPSNQGGERGDGEGSRGGGSIKVHQKPSRGGRGEGPAEQD